MIELDYHIHPSDRSWERDLATASDMELRYRLFCGDVVFRVDDWDASADWGWVTVLDFALCLGVIADELAADPIASSTFEYTESDATIVFSRVGDVVELSADYTAGTALVPMSELTTAVKDFRRRVLTELVATYPSLAANPVVVRELEG